MKQAIEEKYILDVLRNYTTYKTYYKLANGLSPDKELPKGKASSALARFASLHPTHLAQKAEIIVEHYRAHTSKKIGGRAKAMVVTRSRLHAVRYKQAIDAYITEKDYKDVRTLVAFSGKVLDPTNRQVDYTEAGMNEIPSNDIPKEFAKSYQVLIVAEKFQTGFDQPLLHTMYVDKKLRDLKAVQTLSRLNRIHPNKDDTFVLDFENDLEDIQAAFKPYFEETEALASDPNVLFDLQRSLMSSGVIAKDEMRAAVEGILLGGTAGSSMLKANSDPAVGRWRLLEADDREQFRSDCNNFVKTYAFLGLIVPFQDPDLEELYYFSKFLVRRLIVKKDSEDIDLDGILLTHLKVEMTAQEKDISLSAGLESPLAGIVAGAKPKPQQDPKSLLSELIGVINDKFGVNLTDADRVWFEQQEVHLAGNVEIREVALENDYDNFEMFLRPRIADQVIERNDANLTLFNAFFDKPEFAELMIQAMAKSLYTKFNTA
jgi:type I restriction enzyme, R subunit